MGSAATTTLSPRLVANADRASTDARHGVWLGLTNNDTDSLGDPIYVASLDVTGLLGTLTINPAATNGVWYNPGTAFDYLSAGEAATDTFSYTASDGHGGTATATASVTVTGVNQPPVARADAASTAAGQTVVLTPLANDTDVNRDDTLAITALNTTATLGSAVLGAGGVVTYTPGAAFATLAAGAVATDSFSYTVSDGRGGLATATDTVTIMGTSTGPGTLKPAFYVATDGNDAWSGRLSAPNAAGTDGPLATLAAAQVKMRASPAIKTTYVEGGDYYLRANLNLTGSDSGESWLAMPGQTPVLHGGQAVTGWTNAGNGIWTATAPAGAFAAGGGVADLFVDGVRETHARYPDAVPTAASASVTGGWLAAAPSLPGENTASQFQFNPGDLPAFASSAGLYAVVYEQNGWQSVALPIASIDAATDTVTLAGAAGHPIDAGSRYYIYNAASQLDAPGEWFYDPASNQISLYAPAGFAGSGVTVGSLPAIVTDFGGNNITLAGFTITGGTSTGNGVRIGNTTGVTLAGDTITDVGNGILFSDSGRGDTVEGSVIADTDDNGILVYPGTSGLIIAGNSIHDIGQLVNGDGIWFTGSSDDLITHNLVQNVAGSGIAGGSALGAADASYLVTISDNQVVGTNLDTSDGGGIYIAGVQQTLTGDRIDGNVISGTTALGTAASGQLQFLAPSQQIGFGIYLDDYASGVTVQDNLLTGNLDGIDIHAGWLNHVTGNTLVDTGAVALQEQAADWRGAGAHPSTDNVFTSNVIDDAVSGARLAVDLADPSAATWLGNTYAASGLSASAFVSDTAGVLKMQGLAGWQSAGFDAGSVSGTAGWAALSQAGLAGYVVGSAYDLFGQG